MSLAGRIPVIRGCTTVRTFTVDTGSRLLEVAFRGPLVGHDGARCRDYALRYAAAVASGAKDVYAAARALRGQV